MGAEDGPDVRAADLLEGIQKADISQVTNVLRRAEEDEVFEEADHLTVYAAHEYAKDDHPGVSQYAADILDDRVEENGREYTLEQRAKRNLSGFGSTLFGANGALAGASYSFQQHPEFVDANPELATGLVIGAILGSGALSFQGGRKLYDVMHDYVSVSGEEKTYSPKIKAEEAFWDSDNVESLRDYVHSQGWADLYQ